MHDSIKEKDYSGALFNSAPIVIDEGFKLAEKGLVKLGINQPG